MRAHFTGAGRARDRSRLPLQTQVRLYPFARLHAPGECVCTRRLCSSSASSPLPREQSLGCGLGTTWEVLFPIISVILTLTQCVIDLDRRARATEVRGPTALRLVFLLSHPTHPGSGVCDMPRVSFRGLVSRSLGNTRWSGTCQSCVCVCVLLSDPPCDVRLII